MSERSVVGELLATRQYAAAAARLRRKRAHDDGQATATAAEGWMPAFTPAVTPAPRMSKPRPRTTADTSAALPRPYRLREPRDSERRVPAYVGLTSITYAFARHR